MDAINKIKELDNTDFMYYCINRYKYHKNDIFDDIYPDYKYYKLFLYFVDYYEHPDNELLNLILDDKDYFIDNAKKEVLNELQKLHKLYTIKFSINDNIDDIKEIIVEEISKYTENIEYYDYDKVILVETEISKFNIIKNCDIKDLEELSVKIVVLEHYIKNNNYHIEFKDAGMLNYGIEFISISKYL